MTHNILFHLLIFISLICDHKLYSSDISNPKKKIVYFIASMCGSLFDLNSGHNRDDCLQPTYQLYKKGLENGYEFREIKNLNFLEDFEYLFVFEVYPHQIEQIQKYPKEKLILFLWEPPSVLPINYDPQFHEHFSRVYTWNDELVDNKKYFKFYYPVLNEMTKETVSFENKKLCTSISCNKSSRHPNELYSERVKVIEFFEVNHPDEFDFYGFNWPSRYKTYKGSVEAKTDCFKKYKFAFTYENVKGEPGYVTEKIFDCFRAGTVPIYCGASNIENYVPKKCFIAKDDFDDYENLYQFLKSMDKKQYEAYINNIKEYLKSDKAKLFSIENFIEIVMNIVQKSPHIEEKSE